MTSGMPPAWRSVAGVVTESIRSVAVDLDSRASGNFEKVLPPLHPFFARAESWPQIDQPRQQVE
jgi:hypothetical protein